MTENYLIPYIDISLNLLRYARFGKEANRLMEVILGTKLENREGMKPHIKKVTILPAGKEYVFKLPAGISHNEFLDRKIYFETYTSRQVDIYPGVSPYLVMRIYKADFPNLIPYALKDFPGEMLAPLPVGITPAGTLLYIDLSELPHMLVGGLPGYGKTSWLIGAAVALKTAGVEVCIIDRKRIDFPPFRKWFNVAESELEALGLIKLLQEENTRRQDQLRAADVSRIQDYSGHMPYICLIVDEAAALEMKETYKGIDSLSRLARATGISIILATQKASAALWDKTFSNTRDMLAGRLSFYVADYMTSQVILGKGNTAAAALPMVKGRAVAVMGDRENIVQTMFLHRDKARELLTSMDARPYFLEIPLIEEKPPEPKRRGRKKKNPA